MILPQSYFFDRLQKKKISNLQEKYFFKLLTLVSSLLLFGTYSQFLRDDINLILHSELS